jgi:hypothetical protein
MGYEDRFLGILEVPFSKFDWGSVREHVLPGSRMACWCPPSVPFSVWVPCRVAADVLFPLSWFAPGMAAPSSSIASCS